MICTINFRLNSTDRPESKTIKRGKKTAIQTPAKEDVAQAAQVKTEVVATIKTEVKTEVIDRDYPNYMESIETVINASKEVMIPKAQTTVNKPLPYHHDHQYSRITFYGSGETNATETKAQEIAIKEEKMPIPPKVSGRKQLNVNVQTVKKPRKQSHQVIRPQPIIYRFEPNNGFQQPMPAYFMPSIASTSLTHTVSQHTPAIIRSIHRPVPSIYANGTVVPLNFKTSTKAVQGSVIQQPIYYLRFCNPQE